MSETRILAKTEGGEIFTFTKALVSRDIYPVLWLGEKSLSIKRLARIVKLEHDQDFKYVRHFIYNVGRVLGGPEEIDEEINNIIGGIYIVSGGVHPPVVGRAKRLWQIKRDETTTISLRSTILLVPTGIGSITNAIEIEPVEIEWEERDPTQLPLLYDPPQRYRVVQYSQYSPKYALEIVL